MNEKMSLQKNDETIANLLCVYAKFAIAMLCNDKRNLFLEVLDDQTRQFNTYALLRFVCSSADMRG
jgi:hypothetical protein